MSLISEDRPVRYFRKPLWGPRLTESQNPPAAKKEVQKNPKTPLSPKVNVRSPNVNARSSKVNGFENI